MADLEIRWPNGLRESVKAVPPTRLITIREGQGVVKTETLGSAPDDSQPDLFVANGFVRLPDPTADPMDAHGQGPRVPAKVTAHVGSATRLMQDRHYDEAAAEFEKALAADPNNDAVRIQYATCLFAQERNDEARKQFEIEQRRLGDRPGLIYFLGLLDLRSENLHRGNPETCSHWYRIQHFQRRLSILAWHTSRLGKTTEAIQYLEQAARAEPRDPDVHYRLGRIYAMANRQSDADREFQLYRQWRESQRIAEQDGQKCMDALRTTADRASPADL